ncbi:hypothetical protein VPNG_08777 [Cytospora leucostoma]|uniref:F-box domain-containing protein n=1 Tax=Cytospora leucostoma TaxID=1230097 RepID=A0A423VXP4_9PEZI|nr:hypothetical protein VPNG_08777 [Cytospora leucostoma]
MASASRVLRYFDLASPTTREDILHGLIDLISLEEAELLAKARHKHDVFGHDRMPLEIRLMIVQYLDITDICNCALLVCRKWTNLFMKSEAMAQDVLQTWFPCLYHRAMSVRDMLESFAQVIVKRYLRDTGRFQTRLTSKCITDTKGGRHNVRIEGLRQGHTFKERRNYSACIMQTSYKPPLPIIHPAGETSAAQQPRQPLGTYETTVHKVLYAYNRLAWQMEASDLETPAICFYDLHSTYGQLPCVFRLPKQQVTGIKLTLEAIGDELIVATDVRRRKLYARDFGTQTDDSVNLPASLEKCVTQGRSVIITTKQGDLLLWTFLSGMVQMDTNTMPRNPEAYRGPPQGQTVPIRPLTTREVRRSSNFFHPEDSKVSFLATQNDEELRVYEFRNMLCSRIFTYNAEHIFEIPPYGAWVTSAVAAEKVDAHGTYALLSFHGKVDGVLRIIYVVYNTLATSFSTLSFAPCPERGVPNTLWNGQLYLHAGDHPHESRLCVLQSVEAAVPLKCKRRSAKSVEEVLDTAVYFKKAQDELRTMQDEILTGASKNQRHDRTINGDAGQTPIPRDIVRYQDLSREYPHATDFHDDWGLLYTCSFFKGADRRQLHGTSFSFSYDQLFADDDFLIVVSHYGVYTVFAVDADGKLSKAWLRG